ncbi:MAG: riboflavin synthase [SAR202 cluster bacterium]|nr:riboflavin synthase [SAR202 cluster bacterium]|tara:strand:- start:10122 stop:10703 length:582 start_codon:yes stop_codon:yes gene_type:complete
MFTGIVQETGKITKIEEDTYTVTTDLNLQNLEIGGSIALNGACLTIISIETNAFSIQVTPETLKRTNIKYLKLKDTVNLELPLILNSGLDGHMVQGHIDDTGSITQITPHENSIYITIQTNRELMRYICEKGYVAVDGVSLTIVNCTDDEFTVSIIPHTKKNTVFSINKIGDIVNIEVDIISKYVEKLLNKRT